MEYEAVYLYDIEDGFDAQRLIDECIVFYNAQRPHSSLRNLTPDQSYAKQTKEPQLAA